VVNADLLERMECLCVIEKDRAVLDVLAAISEMKWIRGEDLMTLIELSNIGQQRD
jgi:hypothetical protein